MEAGCVEIRWRFSIHSSIRLPCLSEDTREPWQFKKSSKGWIALKWQILWETNKFPVSFCSPFKFVRRFFVEKKRAIANNKGTDQPAQMRRLICTFVVRTYIKAGFLSDRSSTSCTTFVLTALQWRTNIHTLKQWVYLYARINTKLNISQSHFL